MPYTWIVIFGYSIFVAVLIGGIRLFRIDRGFYPFLLCILLAGINEVLSVWMQKHGLHTAVNNNIYVLLEALLFVRQLKNWGAFGINKNAEPVTMVLLIAGWIVENFLYGSINQVQSPFRLAYSLLLVVLAVQVVCRLIIMYKGRLVRHPVFCISAGFILYYTYKILVEIFWLYGLNASPEFLDHVYLIHAWINLLCNLVYALAVLWMPAKQPYSMRY